MRTKTRDPGHEFLHDLPHVSVTFPSIPFVVRGFNVKDHQEDFKLVSSWFDGSSTRKLPSSQRSRSFRMKIS